MKAPHQGAPLKRKKPTTYFVNSMGDLFHEDCPDEWIDKVFAVMALCPQHTFQVLTKRAARMRDYMSSRSQPGPAGDEAPAVDIRVIMTAHHAPQGKWARRIAWPLPNVWLGVSTERQQEADERIPLLLQTPAAVRFISAEPLLGPIDLTNLGDVTMSINAFTGEAKHLLGMRDKTAGQLDWVITGGESGPRARPMHPDWARSLRDQCAAAGVPFFFKQHGEFREFDTGSPAIEEVEVESEHAESILPLAIKPSWLTKDGRHFRTQADIPEETPCRLIERVGKKAAGRHLDGALHDAMPQADGKVRS